VLPMVGAAEEASAGNGKDRPGTPAPHEDAVHVYGIIVHIVPVAHVLPVLATVEAADDAADFDGPVDLVGVGGIGGQLQDTLGRVGTRSHGDFGEAHGHRQLLPALTTVFTPKDLTVLVTSVQHLGVMRIK